MSLSFSKLSAKKLLIFCVLVLSGCAEKPTRKAEPMTYEIKPDQSIVALDHFLVKHEGYGHRITDGGDRSFFILSITEKSKPGSRENLQIALPIRSGESYEWRNLQLQILSCDDEGPPHNQNASVKFSATKLKTVAKSAKHVMTAGDAFDFEDGPTLKLTDFGHEDDGDGSHTIANFIVSYDNLRQNLNIFSSSTAPMVESWRDWSIQIHRWNEQGPPHTPAQSVEVSVVRKQSTNK